MAPALDINTGIYHLKELPLYASEKPYTMRYTPHESIPVTNIVREKHDVHVQDIRPNKSLYTLIQHGFTVVDLDTSMTYQDFDDADKITSLYIAELEKLMKRLFPGSEIDFVSYLIRKRDSSFPFSTGIAYPHGQPNIVAHIDATAADLIRQIQRRYSEQPHSITTTRLSQRCQYITLWKPLRGPLHDYPLALCDGNSVNRPQDLQPQDIVDRDEVLENVHLHYRPDHKWYYLSGQQSNEVLIFRQADTDTPGFGTPHCAIANPTAPDNALPRESIEVVAFVYGGQ